MLKNAAGLVIVVWGVTVSGPFLIPLCLSALLAFLMTPMVQSMRKRHVPEWACVLLSALLLLTPLCGLVFGLVTQGQSFSAQFPAIILALRKTLSGLVPEAMLEKMAIEANQGVSAFVGGLAELLNGISRSLLIIVIAVLMISTRTRVKHAVEHLFSRSKSLNGPALIEEVPRLIQRYLFVRFLIGLGVGAVCGVVIAILGIPYGLLLGGFLGLMSFLPLIGYLIALVPIVVVVLSSTHSTSSFFGILGTVLFCNVLDAYFLTPKLVGNQMNINALMTIIGLFGGGLIWGIWGVFLSVPVLAVLRIFLSAVPMGEPWGEMLTYQTDRGAIRLFKKIKVTRKTS